MVLVGRVATTYVAAVGIGMIVRFERLRWQAALARERQLLKQRIELSQQIHDTIAQTASMINPGIHRARALAADSDHDLQSALDGIAELTRSAMWDMRGPSDAGHTVEGRELGQVLWSTKLDKIENLRVAVQVGCLAPGPIPSDSHRGSPAFAAKGEAAVHGPRVATTSV